MTDTRKVIWISAKMGNIVNACAWLANLSNSSRQYQIWCASYQLIASWCHIRRLLGTNKSTCAYYLFTLVSYYWTAVSFNLYVTLHELDTLHRRLKYFWDIIMLMDTHTATITKSSKMNPCSCVQVEWSTQHYYTDSILGCDSNSTLLLSCVTWLFHFINYLLP